MTPILSQSKTILPHDHEQAVLIGRIWTEGLGPTLVHVTADHVFDISGIAPTSSALLEMEALPPTFWPTQPRIAMIRPCPGSSHPVTCRQSRRRG
jgi:fumarylacetoacetate (FAA) hydrolase family protein